MSSDSTPTSMPDEPEGSSAPEGPSAAEGSPTKDPSRSQESRAGGDGPRKVALAAVCVLALVALVTAGWFGYGWGRVLLVERPEASARDAALVGAKQAAINLNSMDGQDIDGSISAMRSSITGDALENDLAANEQRIRDQVAASSVDQSAEVVTGAVTELDRGEGTAEVMVLLDVHRQYTAVYIDERRALNVAMRKDGDTWKATTVEQVTSTTLRLGRVDEQGRPIPPGQDQVPGGAEAAPENPAPENPAPENPVPDNGEVPAP
ncbi:hypothetical protein [Rhodococcus yananensis]|uniref:hypothetical protein n=1 Tax=Rhodococcus yananensis TaxID=2879464 RepID=UPI003EBC9A91